ncbi:cellulose binding domain-containing protein [Spirosoma fluviale]|uniref:Cellulose binding domain-containing protein n=1 Tax=Spirosoma fluviale TaxID=1597977 RepID=A0A286FBY9_9BACT|nr:cellulose binding domain-containing protein [Spirosoma fluviale]SOD80758.1 Cellulose binding domain-containing protein [Spirosoma fluviale]
MQSVLRSTSRIWLWCTAVLLMYGATAKPVQQNGPAPTITVTPSSLTILNYSEYEGQFPATYTVSARGLTNDLVITAPPYFLLSAQGKTGPSVALQLVDGEVPPTQVSVILLASSPGTFTGVVTNVSGSATATVAVSGTAITQSVSVSPNALNPFTTTVGQPSASQSYTVTSRGGLAVIVNAPAGFEIRTGGNPFGPSLVIGSSLSYKDTQVDVRLIGSTAGPVSGVVSNDTYYHSAHLTYPVAVSGVVTPVSASPSLSVLHRDADYGNRTDQLIRPYLALSNEGNTAIPYSQITLRYWFTAEGASPPTDLQVYYAQLGTQNVRMKYVPLSEPRRGAFGYVEYSFDASAGSLAAKSQSGPIENGILKRDRSNFNESDDYSYAPATTFTRNSHVTAYLNGQLIWGEEPALVPSVQQVKVFSAAKNSDLTSSISTVLEIRNEGNVAIPLADLTVRYWFTSETSQLLNSYVDYAQLGTQTIRHNVVRLAQLVAGADSYVELGFSPGSAYLQPLSSTGQILFRLVKPDFSLLNQANDYSHGSVSLAENPRITVYRQGTLIYGTEPSGGMGRVGIPEKTTSLQVKLLGNPVENEQLLLEARGAEGLPLVMQLVDRQGVSLFEKEVKEAAEIERQQVEMSRQPSGTYLLRIRTPTQEQVLKVIKP